MKIYRKITLKRKKKISKKNKESKKETEHQNIKTWKHKPPQNGQTNIVITS